MSQTNVDFSDNPTGSELMDNYLAREQENSLTSNSGIQRPSYAKVGTKWLDTSVEPWVLKMYSGSGDVVIGYIDKTKGTFQTPMDTEVVHRTGNETISGIKTFTKEIVRKEGFGGGGASAIKTVDSNGKGVTSLVSYYLNNTIFYRMLAENITAGKNAYIDVRVNNDGSADINFNGSATQKSVSFQGATKVRVPTPSSSAEGGEAVNISYLKSVLPTITYWD